MAPSQRIRPRRTVFACEGVLVKAPGLSRKHPRMPVLSLFVRRVSPPKSLLSKASARSRAALWTRPPQLHSPRTTVPRLATPSKSPRMDGLILAARRLPVSKNPLLRWIAPDLAVPETSMSKTMTPRAFMRTRAVQRSTPLNLQPVGVQGLFVEHLRTRSPKSFPMPSPLASAASHQSRIS